MKELKIIACYIGDNEPDVLSFSLDSVLPFVDKIIFVWGMECQKTREILKKYEKKYPEKLLVIERKFEHEHPGANGRARNVYLEYVKKHYKNDWCIVLDPDEILEGGEVIKEVFTAAHYQEGEETPVIISPRMIHYINNFGLQDATQKIHFCPTRFFKIVDGLYYDEAEHVVLKYKGDKQPIYINHLGICLFHLAYAKNMFNILKRYKNHLKKSNIHSKEYLRKWYFDHIFNTYPVCDISPLLIPKVLRKEFLLEDLEDEVYFANRRNLEAKHFIDAFQWKMFFNPKNILIIGCGGGQRVFACKTYGMNVKGFDKSKWVIENTYFPDLRKDKTLFIGDIVKDLYEIHLDDNYELVVAYDVLEHIKYEDIDKTLKNIYTLGNKYFLFSIPFKGDPNLDADKTHIIKEDKQWWVDKLEKHKYKILETPNNMLYNHQIILCTNKKETEE